MGYFLALQGPGLSEKIYQNGSVELEAPPAKPDQRPPWSIYLDAGKLKLWENAPTPEKGVVVQEGAGLVGFLPRGHQRLTVVPWITLEDLGLGLPGSVVVAKQGGTSTQCAGGGGDLGPEGQALMQRAGVRTGSGGQLELTTTGA